MGPRERGAPRGWRGWVKLLALPWIFLFRLPAWWIRGVRARRIFRRELCAAGVPGDMARTLAKRYRMPSLRGMAPGRKAVAGRSGEKLIVRNA